MKPEKRPSSMFVLLRIKISFVFSSCLLCAVLCAAPGTAAEENTDDLIRQLLLEVESLRARISNLEADPPGWQQEIVVLKTTLAKHNWIEHINLKGDLRTRYENIDDAAKTSDRNRHRIRARVEASAKLNSNWSAGIGLASGGDDPRSTNQSLGAGATTKGMGLDLAYVRYRPTTHLSLISGKFKNPFHRVGGYPLVWDSDYRPEGFAMKFNNGDLWGNAMVHFLESDNNSGGKDAETAYGFQVGMARDLDGGMGVVLGASYYLFAVKGSSPFYKNDPVGNSVAADGTYLFDYEQLELFVEASFSLRNLPLNLFLDYVQNLDVSKNDMSWAVGVQLGKASAPGTWQIAYRYQDLEADAIYGATTDSDFGGGVTDNRGHVVQASFAFPKKVKLGLKYILSEYGRENQGFYNDYNRLQLDLQLKF